MELTEISHHLKCKVVVKKVTYQDYQSQGVIGNTTRDMVFLVPTESTERDTFFAGWLPDGSREENPERIKAGYPYEVNEIVMKFMHPFHTFARGGVMRGNDRCEEPHIYLMHYGLTRIMAEQKSLNGNTITFEVLPESDDAYADQANKGDDLLTFEKKEY